MLPSSKYHLVNNPCEILYLIFYYSFQMENGKCFKESIKLGRESVNCTLSANWCLNSASVFTKIWSPSRFSLGWKKKGDAEIHSGFSWVQMADNAQQATGYSIFSINHLPFLTTDFQVASTIWGLKLPCGLLIADLHLPVFLWEFMTTK